MIHANKVCRTVLLLLLASLIPANFAGAQEKVLLMATTTSTEDTGLLNVTGPGVQKSHGCRSALDRHRHRQGTQARGELRRGRADGPRPRCGKEIRGRRVRHQPQGDHVQRLRHHWASLGPGRRQGQERQGRLAGHSSEEGQLCQPRGQVRHPHDGDWTCGKFPEPRHRKKRPGMPRPARG